MTTRHARLLFLVLIVLVTLLFFVHLPDGSFQSKNGPTTPVNNLRFAVICLFVALAVGRIVAYGDGPFASAGAHWFPTLQHSPAASSAGISLRC
jgi:heme A synthase